MTKPATVDTPSTVRDTPGDRSNGGGLIRLTVNLTPKAHAALLRGCELSGDSKTDTVNRALQIYALIQELTKEGGGNITLVNANGERERIHIL